MFKFITRLWNRAPIYDASREIRKWSVACSTLLELTTGLAQSSLPDVLIGMHLEELRSILHAAAREGASPSVIAESRQTIAAEGAYGPEYLRTPRDRMAAVRRAIALHEDNYDIGWAVNRWVASEITQAEFERGLEEAEVPEAIIRGALILVQRGRKAQGAECLTDMFIERLVTRVIHGAPRVWEPQSHRWGSGTLSEAFGTFSEASGTFSGDLTSLDVTGGNDLTSLVVTGGNDLTSFDTADLTGLRRAAGQRLRGPLESRALRERYWLGPNPSSLEAAAPEEIAAPRAPVLRRVPPGVVG
jgi:hypothetical protein